MGTKNKTSLASHIQWEIAPEHGATPSQTFLKQVTTDFYLKINTEQIFTPINQEAKIKARRT